MTRIRPMHIIAGVIIIAIAVVGMLSKHDPPSATAQTPAPVTDSPAPYTGPGPGPVTGSPTGSPSVSPSVNPIDPGDAADIAVQFVTAWTSRKPKEAAAPWLARMAPYASKPLLDGLAVSAPDAVQAHKVTGQPSEIDKGQYGAQFVVPVDAGPSVLCGMTNTGSRWLVTSLRPVTPDAS